MNDRLHHLIESLEPRKLLTGVTLITHGYGGNASDWVTTMGNLVAQQAGTLAAQPIYKLTVTDPGHDGGPLSIASTRIGPTYANWGSRDIVVLLDWSDVAGALFGGYSRTTSDVGTAVANQLLANNSIPDLATPLAQLPIHAIGHSRGASLISEMARVLGTKGVWVDQLTYLDPHPVDGIRDPFGINLGDPEMRVYSNVQYADDFWRTDGDTSFDFTGEPVNGAYNLQLNETALSSGGYSGIQHSDTHLWYHGTIGPPFSDNDGSASIGANYYSTTTTPAMGPRDQVGWRASRIAGGTRQAGGLKSSGAFRDAVTLAASGANLWDNIQINGLLSNTTLTAGAALSVNANIEDKTAAQGGSRDATISIGLDRDDNPYNGVFSAVSFASSTVADTFNTSLDTSNISGGFRIYAKITNGTNTRYYYATGKAIITAPGFTKTWIGPATGGTWTLASNWTTSGAPAASDKVSIFASDVALDTASTAKIAQIDLQGGASLNLRNHNLVIDYTSTSPITTIRAAIIAGRGTSVGLYSDLANASGSFQTLGYAEASDVLHLTGGQTAGFASTTVDATSVLIRYTYAGDADLNGTVNGDDYFRTDAGYTAHASGFSNGDFDFSNAINADDYFLLDVNYARRGAVLSTLSVASIAPIPHRPDTLAFDPQPLLSELV